MLATIAALLVVAVGITAQGHDYNILIRSVKQNYLNEEVLDKEGTKLRSGFFNDSMPVMEGKLVLLVDMPDSMTIHVKGAQQNTNGDWVDFFDQSPKNYCEYITDEASAAFIKNLLDASNLEGCPMTKGEYVIKDMVVDEKVFPADLPKRKWKVDIILADGGKQFLNLSIFADVEIKFTDD